MEIKLIKSDGVFIGSDKESIESLAKLPDGYRCSVPEENKVSQIATEKLSHVLYLKGVELGKAEEDYIVRDNIRKILLASMVEKLRINDPNLALNKAENEARCDLKYRQYISDLGESKRELFTARAKYSAVDAEIKIRLSRSFRESREMNSGKMDT